MIIDDFRSGEAGFWVGRMFGASYEFSVSGSGRIVLKASIPVDSILHSAVIQVDQGWLRYRVFGWPNSSRETAGFGAELPIVVSLNTMSFSPLHNNNVTFHDGGEFDETDLIAFPTSRVKTSDNSVFSQTAGVAPGGKRGFGVTNAYIVMEALDANIVTGVLEFRFEERIWGY